VAAATARIPRMVDDGPMTERALSFGAVASAYERFRLGYPDGLVDEVLAYAGAPIRTALEIGAGTGKATRAFAARGIAVTATDPDPAMLAELRRHVPPTVSTVRSSFEDLPLASTYDLVLAAASLHWTDPEGRWSRMATLLGERGVFASFGGQLELDDPAVDADVRAVRSRFLADDGVPPPDGTPDDSAMLWPGTELRRSDRFTDVRQIGIERRAVMSARDYLGHLSTISAYLQLPGPAREELFDRILAVLPAEVTLNADLVLHLARVVTPQSR
jgi:SAM-dependent methyltransferase